MTTKRLPQCLYPVFAGLAVAALAACSGGPAVPPAPAANGATSPAAHGAAGGATTPEAASSATAPDAGQTSAADGPNATVSTASASYCTRTPSSLVASTLGLAVGKQVPVIEGPVAVCAYTGRYEVVVRYQVSESHTLFGQDESSMRGLHQTVTAVSDLGDDAFSATTSGAAPIANTLAARKGTVAIFITSPASLTAERTLMARLLQQL